MLKRLMCRLGFHDWRLSRFVALGSYGPSFVCNRCGKVEYPNDGQ